jgi:hypothetical protein
MKKAMRRYGSPNEIVTDMLRSYSAAAWDLGCAEKQVTKRWAITELKIHTYPFDKEKEPCFDLGACTVYRSSPPSMPRFTICSIRKGHSQNVVHSSLTATLLLQSGALLSLHRIHAPKASDAWAGLSDTTSRRNASLVGYPQKKAIFRLVKFMLHSDQLDPTIYCL